MQHVLLQAVVAAGLVAAGVVPAVAGESDEVQQLRAEVAVLRAELSQFKRAARGDELTQERADEIRALVHDVLADADARSSLLQDGATAGWDKGFFLRSADGNNLLRIKGQVDFRFAYNHRRDDSVDNDNWGFHMRRIKLSFEGHIVDETWRYKVKSAFQGTERSASDGSLTIGGVFFFEDVYIDKDLGNGMNLKFGQFKAPLLREELVSSAYQLAVERSLVNEQFNQDRSQGVELGWKSDALAVKAMVHDGLGSDYTFLSITEWAFAARLEWLAAGTWKQFDDFTSWSGEEFAFMLGAAMNYESQEYGTAMPSPKEKTFTWTVDASAEFGGANLFAAIVGRHLEEASLDQLGVVVQGGVFLTPDEWELYARYEWGDLDSPTIEDVSIITVGVNRYWNRHGLKWTTDVGYGLNAVDGAWDSSGAVWLADPDGRDGQIVVRSQFQLLF